MKTEIKNNQYDVFISYAQTDSEWARSLAEVLSIRGVRVFSGFSEASFHPGEAYRRRFQKMLQDSEYVVVVVSESSANSAWVAFVVGAALSLGKEVVPVVSKEVPREDLSGPIRVRQALEKSEPETVAQQLLTMFSKEKAQRRRADGVHDEQTHRAG